MKAGSIKYPAEENRTIETSAASANQHDMQKGEISGGVRTRINKQPKRQRRQHRYLAKAAKTAERRSEIGSSISKWRVATSGRRKRKKIAKIMLKISMAHGRSERGINLSA